MSRTAWKVGGGISESISDVECVFYNLVDVTGARSSNH